MSVQVAVPLACAAFFAAAIVLPLVRLWVRTGVFGVVVQRFGDPLQAAFALSVAAIGAWALALAALGPARVGVWDVPLAVQAVGWLLFAAGFALTVAAQANLGASWRIGIDDRPTALVQDGLYAWVRNPIYAGVLVMLAGLAALAPSVWTLLAFAVVTVVLGRLARAEERHLERVHGREFRVWASRVGRFLPFVGRLDAP